MSGNTILLDIKGIVPAWDMYTLSLDIKYPVKRQTQSEDCTETSSMIEQEQAEPNISIKDEEECYDILVAPYLSLSFRLPPYLLRIFPDCSMVGPTQSSLLSSLYKVYPAYSSKAMPSLTFHHIPANGLSPSIWSLILRNHTCIPDTSVPRVSETLTITLVEHSGVTPRNKETMTSQELEEAHGGYVSCAISPCRLLIRLNTADGEPTEKYMVRAFDSSLIDKEIAKKKAVLEEIKEMCYGNLKHVRLA
ncbi:hypothetical protein PAXINDRAFT_9065 [Paxillus involutus ATCC 200175]|nr:hypothetical protein PAXINDRAFT_9065 [Paxillus involutus ATCC 200175]